MQIGKNFKIESDEMNVVILERHVVGKGKSAGQETWKSIAYCGTLEYALEHLINLQVNRTGMKTVEDVAEKMKELRRDILEALQSVKSHEKGTIPS